MREFNTALLEKWCWRIIVDRGGLSYTILVARYGEDVGMLEDGGWRGSSWWWEVVKIRDGRGVDGGE